MIQNKTEYKFHLNYFFYEILFIREAIELHKSITLKLSQVVAQMKTCQFKSFATSKNQL